MIETTTESNKALYRSFIQEVFILGKVEKVNDYLSPDYKIRDTPPGTPSGQDGVVSVVRMFHQAFPDLNIIIEDQIAEGNFVASRTVTRGTHRGSIFGVPPSNKTIAVPGLTMVKIVDGRIAESSVKNDMIALLKQIGATSIP
jgi:steroid delta-isomerase-like uncharacterized protein